MDGGQRVVVGDEVEALALVLQGDVLPDGAEVVAQVQFAGRLHAAEDAFRLRRRHGLFLLLVGLYPVRFTLYSVRCKGGCLAMDRSSLILIEALQQALARGDEQRLYKSGKLEGLFPGRTGHAGDAAAQALRNGLLEAVRTEVKGRTTIEWVRLTPHGVDFLHDHQSPAAALNDLRNSLRLNQQAVPLWLDEMRAGLHALEERLAADAQKWQQQLEALTRRAEDTLRRMDEAIPLLPRDLAEAYPWAIDALNYMDRRQSGGATTDCPLPELFGALTRAHPRLSVMDFHEGLRRLHERRAMRLQAADGLANLPQPEYALFDGGKVLYYAAR